MTAALIIVSLAGAVAFVVQELRVRSAKEKVAAASITIRQLENKVSVLSEDMKLATKLVRTLRAEVQQHLEIIRSCDDPAAIAELADKLLNDPYFGARAKSGD